VLRGQLAYEVPTAMHQFTLGFQPTVTSGQTLWAISHPQPGPTGIEEAPTVAPQPTVAPTETPIPATSGKLGQELRVWTGDRSVDVGATPTNAKTSSGGEYDTPEAGHTFVVVTLTLKNYSTTEYDYFPLDFYAMDTNGNLTEWGYHSFVQNQLDSGTLALGGTVTGTVVFEVPQSAIKGLRLTWQPTYDSAKSEYNWQLGL
jgi:hypothetical protein